VLGALIPGAGHICAGEYFKGVSNYVGAIGTIGVGTIVYVLDNCSLDFGPCAAERANARHRTKSPTVAPLIDPFSGPANASQIGVSVHW
jgi:hypothetical protein